MGTVTELTFADTFGEWKEKINALIVDHEAVTTDLSDLVTALGVVGSFTFNPDTSTGLTLVVNGGRVRNGSTVEYIADTTLTLPASSTRVLAIYKIDGVAPSLVLYATPDLPVKEIIPVGIFTTDATHVTAYTDLRTEFNMSSGSAGSASSVLQFDKIIDRSVTISAAKNALSLSPTVPTGIVVTVETGAEWVIL